MLGLHAALILFIAVALAARAMYVVLACFLVAVGAVVVLAIRAGGLTLPDQPLDTTLTTWPLAAVLVCVAGPLLFRTAPRVLPIMALLWDAPRPEVSVFGVNKAKMQTFQLLISSMFVFGALISLWAAGAGVLRAIFLVSRQLDGAQALLGGALPVACTDTCRWELALLSAIQVVRAVGGVLIIATASGLVGAFLGFIFGVPRPVSAAETPPASTGERVATKSGIGPARRAWELSTNLTQVTDWLTKIIVGVGLVESKSILGELSRISSRIAYWLFEMRHGSPVLIGATIAGSTVFGFIFNYLYAELILARLIAASEQDLSEPSEKAGNKLREMKAWNESLVPRISRSKLVPDVTAKPTAEQVEAAFAYFSISLETLSTQTEIRTWARAKAVLSDYKASAGAYVRLLADDAQ